MSERELVDREAEITRRRLHFHARVAGRLHGGHDAVRETVRRIHNHLVRFVGSAFYSHAKVLARNKIMALVSPQSAQPEN